MRRRVRLLAPLIVAAVLTLAFAGCADRRAPPSPPNGLQGYGYGWGYPNTAYQAPYRLRGN